MKSNTKYILLIFISVIMIVSTIAYAYFLADNNNKKLNCHGVHYTYSKNFSIKSNVEINLYSKNGYMIINGIVTNNNIPYQLTRKTLFDISDIDNKTILTFTGIEISLSDEVSRTDLEQMLPSFMSQVGSNLLISIYRINNNNYIIESNGVASFLCNKD
ncbi:Uncharacterised protein [Yersinia frederiksenii]|uniref:hypothetical protein n=1 Tax=Yersinia frederiksenii TaxID=29484 RepID=UPI0005E4AAF2|nr:hypothetical protein [Yersinia frederiksenii]CNB99123.1 Uncharacterised protein [Yersinia frederiksenii]